MGELEENQVKQKDFLYNKATTKRHAQTNDIGSK
jgi:hypothetical protein